MEDALVNTPPPEAVGPLIRGLTVLRRLAEAEGRRSPGDLVRDTGLARSTIDRVLSTLERLGHIRLDGRDAVLTPRAMEFGNAYLAASRFPHLLGPQADRLADELDESVSIAVADQGGVRFVHQATRRRAMSVTFRVGDLLPGERLAAGAVLAAGRTEDPSPSPTGFPALPANTDGGAETFAERVARARRDGWSLDDQLIEPGLVAVAMPVRDASGHVVCAVSVVSHAGRQSAESLRDLVLPRLRRTISKMESALTESPVPRKNPSDPIATWARASKEELGPEFVESLARGLSVLIALGSGHASYASRPGVTSTSDNASANDLPPGKRPDRDPEPPSPAGLETGLTLSEVAQATGLSRATVRRALITLVHLGYASEAGRGFLPTPRVLELGFACLSTLPLPQIAQPHLTTLVDQVHDSASMAVLDGTDIRYVARVPTVRIMSVDITLGTRFPAYATSMGRVLLADLPEHERAAILREIEPVRLTPHTVTSRDALAALLDEVAKEGHSLVDEELEVGLRSIAVPVHDRTGRVVAAVNVSTHAGRHPLGHLRASILPHLREAARRITADLGVARRFTAIRTD
ncbi:IclR family transcriptional regulator domain-containing protein [Rhizohabitans arisaemae]|uniref:IclR family transcriptional regulator domain-containing protein n=1 Tax=Rhizohabitans arisaemae TaxID=2720610 RepID=UPI0024B0A5E6|nr:IclR family transcriptional regulator C-terminal domain-containing protein [Rhizohabitans arisaemae]